MGKLEKYTSYKDSGVEWLGEIPKHWNLMKLKYLSSIKTGEKDTVDREDNGIYPFFVRSKNVKTINTYSYDEEAVLTAGDGDIGKIFHYINGKFEYHQRVYKFSNFKYMLGKYLFYYLHHNLEQEVVKLSAKTTVDSLRLPMLQNFYVSLPQRDEQTKIVSFLDEKIAQIDNVISQKEKLIELLNERKQIAINEAVTKGLNKDVEFGDSGVEWIGEMPKHWEISKVKNIFKLIIEPAPKANNEELLSIYTDIGVRPRKDLAEKGNKASTTDGYWRVKKGDFIVNKLLAWMGAVGLSEYEGVTSPAYDILRAKKDIAGRYYHELFRLKVFSQEMKKHSRGIMDMRLRLYFDKFGDILIPYPSYEEQLKIVEYIDNQNEKINKAIELQQNYIQKLKEYKSTLIDSVVTGKVRIL